MHFATRIAAAAKYMGPSARKNAGLRMTMF
jgi:hypothetical protein